MHSPEDTDEPLHPPRSHPLTLELDGAYAPVPSGNSFSVERSGVGDHRSTSTLGNVEKEFKYLGSLATGASIRPSSRHLRED